MCRPRTSRLSTYETDFVAVAERFLGAPYLWGGKTTLGLDCSGLVQIALTACGIACPRDIDMQEQALGTPLSVNLDGATPQRGDLVFWSGHVAIVRDRSSLLHANAFHMSVAIEPIAEAVSRIRDSGSEISSVRRIESPDRLIVTGKRMGSDPHRARRVRVSRGRRSRLRCLRDAARIAAI